MSIYVMPEPETPDNLPEPPAGSLICNIKITSTDEPVKPDLESVEWEN